jgi:hypothetical protein
MSARAEISPHITFLAPPPPKTESPNLDSTLTFCVSRRPLIQNGTDDTVFGIWYGAETTSTHLPPPKHTAGLKAPALLAPSMGRVAMLAGGYILFVLFGRNCASPIAMHYVV